MAGFGKYGGGGGGGVVPNASEATAGIAEIATLAEAFGGLDDTRIITSGKLNAVLGALGRVFFVSTSGDSTTASVGKINKAYELPQDAVDASLTGDTIVIFAGDYAGDITITNKSLAILCIGNVVINGNIHYDTSSAFLDFKNDFVGESTTVNGRFTASTIQTNKITVKVKQVNSGANYAFGDTFLNRTTFIIIKGNVVADYLLTPKDTQGGGATPDLDQIVEGITFTGISVMPLGFSGTKFKACTFNITGIFGVIRDDFNLRATVEGGVINIIGTTSEELFRSSFNGANYTFKLKGVKIIGTTNVLRSPFANRFSNIDLEDCDLSEYTATQGFFNVTDALLYTNWKVIIRNTKIKAGQLVYARGSLRPYLVANEVIQVFVNNESNALMYLADRVIDAKDCIVEDFIQSNTGNAIAFTSSTALGGTLASEAPEFQPNWNSTVQKPRLGQSSNRINGIPNGRAGLSTLSNFRLFNGNTFFAFSFELSIVGGQVNFATDPTLICWGALNASNTSNPTNGFYFRPPRVGEGTALKYVVRVAGAETTFNTDIVYDSTARKFVKGTIVWNGVDMIFHATDGVSQSTNTILNFLATYPSLDTVDFGFGILCARNGIASAPVVNRSLNLDRVEKYMPCNF